MSCSHVLDMQQLRCNKLINLDYKMTVLPDPLKYVITALSCICLFCVVVQLAFGNEILFLKLAAVL